jgi:hypothetical protein
METSENLHFVIVLKSTNYGFVRKRENKIYLIFYAGKNIYHL